MFGRRFQFLQIADKGKTVKSACIVEFQSNSIVLNFNGVHYPLLALSLVERITTTPDHISGSCIKGSVSNV